MQGAAATTGLLQHGSELYGPDLGLAGLCWDWCASTGALRPCWGRPDLTGTSVLRRCVRSTTAFGGGGVPSRTVVVLLTPVHATSTFVLHTSGRWLWCDGDGDFVTVVAIVGGRLVWWWQGIVLRGSGAM